MAQAVPQSATRGTKPPNRTGKPLPAENRETLRDYVQMAAKVMRRNELTYGVMLWLTVVLFVLTTVVLIDHWVWPLNHWARYFVFASLVAWTVWWAPRRILPPLVHPINVEHAARTIEKQLPECKDSLISWLQLSDENSKAPRGVVAYVGRYAIRNLNGQDAVSVVDSATVVRLGAAFFGFLLCGIIYMFASPKSGVTSVARILAPWANIAPATRVQFIEVLPGSTTVTQGSIMPMSVTVRGMHQGEGVRIRFDLSDGQLVGETVAMTPEIESISYQLDFGKSFGGIHQPLKYWILAGDAVQGPYDVTVQVIPLIAIDRTELTFPAYTKLKPRTLLQQGAFEAPEGTQIDLFATANQPMKKARLEFDPVLEQKVFLRARDIVEMNVDDIRVSGTWTALLDEKKSNPTLTSYRIRATNELGESNPDPLLYQVKVIADLAPEVAFANEVPDVVEVPVDGVQEFELRANDPDYGLTQIAVIGVRPIGLDKTNRSEIFRNLCFESQEGVTGQVTRLFQLKPTELGLKSRDEFDLVVVAADNRHAPNTNDLQPNLSETTPIRIRIVDPKSNPKPESDSAAENNTPPPVNEPTKKPNPSGLKENSPPPSDQKQSSKGSDTSSEPSQESGDKSKNGQGSSGGQGSSENAENDEGNSQSSDKKNGSGRSANQQQPSSDGNGQGNGEGNAEGSSDNNSNASEEPSTSKPAPSSRGNEQPTAPPSHDGEAMERIEQYRKEQEQQQEQEQEQEQESNPNGTQSTSNAKEKASNNDKNNNSDAGEQGNNNSAGNQGNRSKNPTESMPQQSLGDADKSNTDKSNTDKSNTDKGNADKGNTDKSNTDKSNADKSNADKSNAEKGNADKSNADKSNAEKGNADKSNADKSNADKGNADKSNADKSNADKSNADKSNADKSNADKSNAEKGNADKSNADKSNADKGNADKSNTDKSNTDKSNTEKSNTEKSNTEKSNTEKSNTEKSNTDKSNTDKSNADKSNADKSNADKSNADKSNADKSNADKSNADKSNADKSNADKGNADKGNTDMSNTDKSNTDKSNTDKSNTDKSNADKGNADKSNADKNNADKSNADKSNADKSNADKSNTDKSNTDKSNADKSNADKSNTDKSNADKGNADKSNADKSNTDKSNADKGNAEKPADQGKPEGRKSQGDAGSQAPGEGGKTDDGGKKDEGGKKDGAPSDGQGGGGDKPSEDEGDPDSSAAEAGAAGSGANQSGKTPKAGGTGAPQKSGESRTLGAEKANTEYAEKTTDMVLDYIDRQRDQPDPELLNRLGWTPDDLRKFSDRWRSAKEQSRMTPEKRTEFEAALRSLGLRHSDRRPDRLKDRDDNLKGMQEDGTRLRPPESLREQFEAFRKAAGKLNKSP